MFCVVTRCITKSWLVAKYSQTAVTTSQTFIHYSTSCFVLLVAYREYNCRDTFVQTFHGFICCYGFTCCHGFTFHGFTIKTLLTQGTLSQNVRLYKVTGTSALKMKGMEVQEGGGGGREEV